MGADVGALFAVGGVAFALEGLGGVEAEAGFARVDADLGAAVLALPAGGVGVGVGAGAGAGVGAGVGVLRAPAAGVGVGGLAEEGGAGDGAGFEVPGALSFLPRRDFDPDDFGLSMKAGTWGLGLETAGDGFAAAFLAGDRTAECATGGAGAVGAGAAALATGATGVVEGDRVRVALAAVAFAGVFGEGGFAWLAARRGDGGDAVFASVFGGAWRVGVEAVADLPPGFREITSGAGAALDFSAILPWVALPFRVIACAFFLGTEFLSEFITSAVAGTNWGVGVVPGRLSPGRR